VKHFKYEPRGKKRIHQKPNAENRALPMVARARASTPRTEARRGAWRDRRPVAIGPCRVSDEGAGSRPVRHARRLHHRSPVFSAALARRGGEA
jgi:hypothetical protein